MAFLLRFSFLLSLVLMVNLFWVHAQTPVFKILTEEKILPARLQQHVSKGSIYKIEEAVITQLRNTKPTELNLQFHFENKDWQLELKPSQIFAKGFFVRTDNDKPFNYNPNEALHYKGSITGQPGSFAAISILKDEIVAVLADKNGNINIGLVKSEDALQKNTHIIFRESDIKASNPFSCTSENLQSEAGNPLPQLQKPLATEAVVNGEPLDIYFEADFSCYQGNGSNVANTANWVAAMFNVVTTLYENDSVYTRISGIKVWTSSDPYVALTSTSAVLYAFAANMAAGFPGDLAHILSRRSLGGGIAFLNVLCGSPYYRTGVSGNLSSSFNAYPAYSWNTMVIAHELGHNIASNHTQWCGWPGGAIDNCYTTEGGCAKGPAPVNGGTIMSYCHLTGYGINLANGFGPLPGATIRNAVRNNPCINPKISFNTNFQTITEETADIDNGCLDYKLINLRLALNYTPSQPAVITLTATNVASPGLEIGTNKDVEVSTFNFTLADTTAQIIQLKVYDDAIIENNETLRLDYSIESNGTNAVKNGVFQLDIVSLDHRPDSTPNQLLYTETFNTISTGFGPWSQTILYGNLSPNRWVIGDAADAQFPTKSAFISANGSSAGYEGSSPNDSVVVRLESPSISASGFSNMKLSYLYKANGEGTVSQGSIGGATGGIDFGNLYYSINNGSSWVLLKENIFGRNNRTLDEINLPPAVNNAPALKLAFVWQNNRAVVNNQPLIIDSIVIKGTGSSPVQRNAHPGNVYEALLGPNQTVHFYNEVTKNIMGSITNKSNVDFGCTSLELIRTGNSTKTAWGDYNAQKITDKSYRVTASNNPANAAYEVSLYYTAEEINGWMAATGNSATDMAIVKTAADITQVPPASPAEFSNYNSVSDYGSAGAKKITGTFVGFSTFSIGRAGVTPICPGTTQQLSANETGLSYQWQVNTGGGFTNVANHSNYSGAATASLSLVNAPTSWYGYKYRCNITDAQGTHPSIEYLLKFALNWTGSSNNNWENITNWGCMYLPDANTDVFVKTGASLYPVVNSNTSVRSLTVQPGGRVSLQNGVQMTIVQ